MSLLHRDRCFWVFAIARQTRDLIEQNIALVVVPNLVALGLATTAGLSPLIATVIHQRLGDRGGPQQPPPPRPTRIHT